MLSCPSPPGRVCLVFLIYKGSRQLMGPNTWLWSWFFFSVFSERSASILSNLFFFLKLGLLTMCVCAKSLQSCLTLWHHELCPPGSSGHGILQVRILEWVAMPSSRGSSWPRDWIHVPCVSCIGRRVLYHSCHLENPLLTMNQMSFSFLQVPQRQDAKKWLDSSPVDTEWQSLGRGKGAWCFGGLGGLSGMMPGRQV